MPWALSAKHQESTDGGARPWLGRSQRQPGPEQGKHAGFWWAGERGPITRRPGPLGDTGSEWLVGSWGQRTGGVTGSGGPVGSQGQEGWWGHGVRRAGGVTRSGGLVVSRGQDGWGDPWTGGDGITGSGGLMGSRGWGWWGHSVGRDGRITVRMAGGVTG